MIVNKTRLDIDAVVNSYSAPGVDEILVFVRARQLTETYSPRPEVLRCAKWVRMPEMQGVTTHNSLRRVVTGDATYLSGFKNGFAIKRVRY
jgi:hypothetical protein